MERFDGSKICGQSPRPYTLAKCGNSEQTSPDSVCSEPGIRVCSTEQHSRACLLCLCLLIAGQWHNTPYFHLGYTLTCATMDTASVRGRYCLDFLSCAKRTIALAVLTKGYHRSTLKRITDSAQRFVRSRCARYLGCSHNNTP